MELGKLGTWMRQTLGGRGGTAQGGKHGAEPRVGMQVTTLDGTVLGTIAMLWRGANATDHATHEDTLGVSPQGQEANGMIFIPSTAIGRLSEQNVALTIDAAQVTARGWRYRPAWLPKDAPGDTAPTA